MVVPLDSGKEIRVVFCDISKAFARANVAEKNILILVKEKKNNLIQSFCHIT
jgi:hypothetical protein